MPFLTDEELQNLHLSGETDRVERKRNCSNNNNNLDKIRQAICAYANDLPDYRLPGVIFIGIENDGSSANLTVTDELLLTLSQMRDDGKILPFPMMEVRQVEVSGMRVAVIVVEPSDNPPVRCEGRVWIRVGPRRAIATPQEESRLIEKRRWGNLPFDAQPIEGASLEDLDLVRFRSEYLVSLVSADTLAQNQRTDEQKLQALRLIDLNGTPTTTAILMLAQSPQDWLPGATIAWRRVAGEALTDDTLDERVLTGTLPDQLRRIDDVVAAVNASPVEMGTTRHTRTSDYPISALQQLIRNAVMHRTYEGTSAPVRVTSYADRFEILSPGGTYGAVTPSTFGIPGITDYRNPTIAEALKGYGFVERFGQGLLIARQSLAANNNPPMEFAFPPPEASAWVHVIVRKRQ